MFHPSDQRLEIQQGLTLLSKTLIARHYISELAEGRQKKSPKNTFWVKADSKASFQESYRRIAANIDPRDPEFNPEDFPYEAVKKRLELAPSKPWFMVVDGLDHVRDGSYIRALLPRSGNGQILITTKNRHLVEGLVNFSKKACIEVDRVSEDASMQIFEDFVDTSLVDKEKDCVKELLDLLWSPDLIKLAAEHMSIRKRDCKTMYERMIEYYGFNEVEQLRPNLAEYLLKPILSASKDLMQRPQDLLPREAQLLLLLCMFDNNEGVSIDLIEVEYDRHDILNVKFMLETLRNCALIKEPEATDNTNDKKYSVNPLVRQAVLAWIEKNEHDKGFLERYNKVLSMMFRIYDKRKRLAMRNPWKGRSTLRRSLNHYKRSLMPHFKLFVQFITNASGPFWDFTFYDRAIQAISTFSDVLADENHPRDALAVLEFAQNHFLFENLGAQSGDDRKKLRWYRTYFKLNRKLVNVYIESGRSSSKGDRLLRRLLREAQRIEDPNRWMGKTLSQWELSLTSVRVLWKMKRFNRAWQQFAECKEINMLTVDKDGLPVLGTQSLLDAGEDVEKWQRLAIEVKREEGLLNLRHGCEHKAKKNLIDAKRSWLKALNAFTEARNATEYWFHHDTTSSIEIDYDLAVARLKTGVGLDEAALTFQSEFDRVKREHGDGHRRTWDLEWRLTMARLEQNKIEIDEAEKILDRLLNSYKSAFDLDHEKTKEYKVELRDVYEDHGMIEAAKKVSDEYFTKPETSAWISKLSSISQEGAFLWPYLFAVPVVVMAYLYWPVLISRRKGSD